MPELPEVESLRRSLLPYILGVTIADVEVKLVKLVSSKGTTRLPNSKKAEEFEKNITGRKIIDIKRRAKNLIFEFENGSIMLVHLKMTGQLVFKSTDNKDIISGGHPIDTSKSTLPNKHSYIIFELSVGTLYYNDIRQFGYLLYYSSIDKLNEEKHFDDLGLEPFNEEFTFEVFSSYLQKSNGTLKKVFLEQKVVVGLGNIYCDEVCFAAKIRPDRMIKSLKKQEILSLYEAILRILPRAVELGGSSVANYLLADGSRGNYAREHKVYKRGGMPCLVCGAILSKIQLVGRTTVFCEICQK